MNTTLPFSLIDSPLTLAEIGAVFLLNAMNTGEPSDSLLDAFAARMNSNVETFESLRNKGFLKHSIEDGIVMLEADLSSLES